MRVLCCTTPMEGTFGPFVALGQALQDAGHEVLVASGPDLQARIEEVGLEGEVAGPPAMEAAMAAIGHPDVQAAPRGDRVQFPAVMFGGTFPPRKLAALRELAGGYRPDLIVHPPTDLAGPLLAAELGRPSACYGFVHPMAPDVVAAMGERAAPLWREAGLEPEPAGGIYRGVYLDPCPASLSAVRPWAAPRDSWPLRPHIPGDPSAPLPAWAERLGRRRTVYVTLGTVPLFNQPDKFRPLLEALSGEDLELVVTLGELGDPAGLGALPEHVHVERWLPLAPLLRRCDAVVCHGGTGTTLAALTAGLPLLLVPQGADQFENAASCARAGAGRVLAPDDVTPVAVRDAVLSLLGPDSGERMAARRVAAEIEAMPGPAAVAERLARELASAPAVG